MILIIIEQKWNGRYDVTIVCREMLTSALRDRLSANFLLCLVIRLESLFNCRGTDLIWYLQDSNAHFTISSSVLCWSCSRLPACRPFNKCPSMSTNLFMFFFSNLAVWSRILSVFKCNLLSWIRIGSVPSCEGLNFLYVRVDTHLNADEWMKKVWEEQKENEQKGDEERNVMTYVRLQIFPLILIQNSSLQ